MKVKMQTVLLVTFFTAAPLVAIAGNWDSKPAKTAAEKDWFNDAMSEPCMNGDVSAIGWSTPLPDSGIRLSHSEITIAD